MAMKNNQQRQPRLYGLTLKEAASLRLIEQGSLTKHLVRKHLEWGYTSQDEAEILFKAIDDRNRRNPPLPDWFINFTAESEPDSAPPRDFITTP